MKKNFIKYSLSVFAFTLVWIVSKGIIEFEKISYDYNPLIVVALVIVYALCLIAIYKWIIPQIVKFKWIKYILYIFFAFALVFCGIKFRINPSWDMGEVFNIAKEYAVNNTYIDSFYLAQFPNNIMMTIVDYCIIKTSNFFGITDYILAITIVNAFAIFMSVVVACNVVKRILGEEKSILMLITCMLMSPLYLYTAEYYTDTYSILPTVLLFFLYLKICDNEVYRKKIVWQILMGIVLFFAIKIKLTSAFVAIAIVLFEICNGNVKKLLINYSLVIPICSILVILFNVTVVPKMVSEEEKDLYEIPRYHWIMMGMEGTGGFSYEEYAYTQSFKTLEQRKEADILKIKERLKERPISTHLKNISTKICFAWQDGTYQSVSIVTTEIVKKGKMHEFIIADGEYNKYYKYIPQVMHYAMLLLMVANIYRIIKHGKYDSKDIVALYSVLGLMMFLVMWENRSRYVFTMILMMLISQLNGVDYLANQVKRKGAKKEE